ncbi:MAG: hypothetical protein CFH06_00316 [Alphaproteobacteria bacterium MarineAlpha3_Bin5]|nr:MAG: hypothetical protein CFH06_00316 [Alphaproteobacteria bacterium MarineAlpha3_Bin5]
MRAYQNEKMFNNNVQYLSKNVEGFTNEFDSTILNTRLVIDENKAFDIDLGGGKLLYSNGAEKSSKKQVENYLDSPNRYFIPLHDPETRASWYQVDENSPLVTFLLNMRERVSSFQNPTTYAPFGGFLFVFGIGLGFHIELLIEKLNFKKLFIIEPHDELIFHNLHIMDWQKLNRKLIDGKRELCFIRGEPLFEKFVSAVHSKNFPFLDGSYIYFHYEMPELSQLREKLLKRTPFLIGSEGWLEDQLLMIQNCIKNVTKPGFFLQSNLSNTRRSLPAIVVGAGPSLDKNIAAIKRCRDNAVVISSSSSLCALLANNITPDIHCALENGNNLGLVLEDLSKKYDFSETTLFASLSVNRRLSACFKRTVYFLRRNVAASHFLFIDGVQTELAEPLTGNTALLCALSFGFKEIYLFGLDFGARSPKFHHTKHSEDFTRNDESPIRDTPYKFETSVRANFGGKVMNGWVLEFSRLRANVAIGSFEGVKARNCSDGAYLPAAPPLAHQSLKIDPSETTQQKEIEAALSSYTFFEKGLFEKQKLLDLDQNCQMFLQTCLSIISGHKTCSEKKTTQSFIVSICELIIDELTLLAKQNPAAYFIFRGDIQTVLSTAYHYASTTKPNFNEKVITEICDILSKCFEEFRELVDSKLKLIAQHSEGHN